MNKPFTVVVSICDSDRDAAIRLFEWIRELQEQTLVHALLPLGCHLDAERALKNQYNLLILDTCSYGSLAMQQVEEQAKQCFSRRSFCGELPVAPWPMGPNASFLMACKLAETPFLWLEPDCVPMRMGWLDELVDEYYAHRKPFMGTIVRTETEQAIQETKLPMRHMTGCGVYPANAREYYHEPMGSLPWDLFAAQQILPFVNDTKLIYHWWGMPGMPPTFVDKTDGDGGITELTVEAIPKKACLFHRCKDGSLIDLLRKRL